MDHEVNGRPGGVQHPEEGSRVKDTEKSEGKGASVDTGGGHKGSTGGAEHLRGADAFGDKGGSDLGRGGD